MKTRLILLALVCLITGLGLVGCGPRITAGEVYEKIHEPACTYVLLVPFRVGKGIMAVPFLMYDDEDWIIRIRQWDPDKQRYRCATYYVSEELYNSVEIGDRINLRGQQYATTDQPERLRKATPEDMEKYPTARG